MAEWSKAAVLKTVKSEMASGVRIPLSPPKMGMDKNLNNALYLDKFWIFDNACDRDS